MAFTPTAILPLPSVPDAIYTNLWGENTTTQPSDTTAFDTGINGRDKNGCVICGVSHPRLLEHCHIIPKAEPHTWDYMRGLGYIPQYAKSVLHEPRNGILMCKNHHQTFDDYQFYIRWNSTTDEFVVVNHSQDQDHNSIHGNLLHFKARTTRRCPFPSAFLWHEYRVRGHHPTRDDRTINIKKGGLRGGGVSSSDDAAVDGGAGEHGGSGGDGNASAVKQAAEDDAHDDTNTSTFTPVRLEGSELAAFLRAARQHSSWKECMVENMPWNGTATENIEKYEREIGTSST